MTIKLNTIVSKLCISFAGALLSCTTVAADLKLNELGYLAMPGLNVTSFADIYPDGHQTGVTVIQHGQRVAANGDLRLETSPGQWSPVPAGGEHSLDEAAQRITQTLSYPDPNKNRKGFNPIVYPDFNFSYSVHVEPLTGSSFKISVDLEKPLPKEWVGKVGFNFELFPQHLFGKAWLLDSHAGIFPNQPNGPLIDDHGEIITAALATGNKLVVAPESAEQRMTIEAKNTQLTLWDGRSNHNNGWFIVRSLVPAGATNNAIEWIVTPNAIKNWQYQPVIQVSQLGYHSQQSKTAIIEQDGTDSKTSKATLYRLTEQGSKKVVSKKVKHWGKFLRYQYLTFDFSEITTEGMYEIEYRGEKTNPFAIADSVYDRNVWQPTLEYYLPVQMCHMRVNEKYRVWHDLCHHDDALMSPVNLNHFDGYISGDSTLSSFKPGERVAGLNKGGWHDAGDYDLRVESQIGTVWLLAMMVEEFGLDYDATLIDQTQQLVEIHQPDGKSDALQQIEHGVLSVLGGYKALGRLYRGIIVPEIRQYVMLGDAASQTDNFYYDAKLKANEIRGEYSGKPDDRWVFTEQNPGRELYVAAGLAAASRTLKTHNPKLSQESLAAAKAIYLAAISNREHFKDKDRSSQVFALTELLLATGETSYRSQLLNLQDFIVANIASTGWALGHSLTAIDKPEFLTAVAQAVSDYQATLRNEALESPFGVPYKPNIWGAGWTVQRFGVQQYFFHKGWPQHTSSDFYINALNFVLGVHPGSNTMSFVSGVGSESALVAYGVNRADWSHIPGGVISGTALIRPDLPELKIWPFFWQQTEYVMGGGATNYMFLALAAQNHFQTKVNVD
ncbi:glycoside hydrolase family 9 protein [Teredinibacter waterburyi]|uniref:glycoside hydrolase family 9 protein n=1 Tax=Teredinibacter waterburyi TaxID=1500538 RepID=UPI00165EDB43|nr:glycoside hydrolase family 9 protein [Teredinibacter waterburyi]